MATRKNKVGTVSRDKYANPLKFGQVTGGSHGLASLGSGFGTRENAPDEEGVCVEVDSFVAMGMTINGGPCQQPLNCEETGLIGGGRYYDGFYGTADFQRQNRIKKTEGCDSSLVDVETGETIPSCECEDVTCPDYMMNVTISGKALWGAQGPGVPMKCGEAVFEQSLFESFNLCDDNDLLKWVDYSSGDGAGKLPDIIKNAGLKDFTIEFGIANKRQKCFRGSRRKREKEIREFVGGWKCLHCITCPVVCLVFGSESDTGDIVLTMPDGSNMTLPSPQLHVCDNDPCLFSKKKHTYTMEDFWNPENQKPDETRALVMEVIAHLNSAPREKLDALTKVSAPTLAHLMGQPFDDIRNKFAVPCFVDGPIEMYDIAGMFKEIVKNIGGINHCR